MRHITDLPKKGDIYSFDDVELNEPILGTKELHGLEQEQEVLRRKLELNANIHFYNELIASQNVNPKSELVMKFIPKRSVAVQQTDSGKAADSIDPSQPTAA